MPTPKDTLIDFPCDFPIKVMGPKADGYTEAMSFVVRQFDPEWTSDRLETRESSGGKYLGLTFTVRATSQAQLDELYRTLSSHPMVKVVL
jgi:putative lipoic acid-binding regulatory protein